MNVTSNTLFHFTKNRETLVKILDTGFKLSFCKEHYAINGVSSGFVYIPMISFCDIPLGQIINHVEKYGGFGIGMTKTWGIKHKLNPVLYIENNSLLSENIRSESWRSIRNSDNIFKAIDLIEYEKNKELVDQIRKDIGKLLSYTSNQRMYFKNYEYDLIRKTEIIKNYRFYDEREWRYIPNKEQTRKKYDIPILEEDYSESISEDILHNMPNLEFVIDDIKYVIVNSEQDINPLIENIKNVPLIFSAARFL
jgi:hypothetical protein